MGVGEIGRVERVAHVERLRRSIGNWNWILATFPQWQHSPRPNAPQSAALASCPPRVLCAKVKCGHNSPNRAPVREGALRSRRRIARQSQDCLRMRSLRALGLREQCVGCGGCSGRPCTASSPARKPLSPPPPLGCAIRRATAWRNGLRSLGRNTVRRPQTRCASHLRALPVRGAWPRAAVSPPSRRYRSPKRRFCAMSLDIAYSARCPNAPRRLETSRPTGSPHRGRARCPNAPQTHPSPEMRLRCV